MNGKCASPEKTLTEVKYLMERSSRFSSLIGFAGIYALPVALAAYYYSNWHTQGRRNFESPGIDESDLLIFRESWQIIFLLFYFVIQSTFKYDTMEAPFSDPFTVKQPGQSMKPEPSPEASEYSSFSTGRTSGGLRIKRMCDITFSLVALLVFSIPSTIIAVLLTCKEKHPIFFRQERIGKNKNRFMILKFQTMVDEVPTETGKILRKTGLDELPQFLSVLKGDMSIVGPRALTQADIQRLGWDDSYHEIRWDLKPGITGFAQLYGGQHRKTSWFWDKHYIKMNNPMVDPAIIVVSFLMNVFGKTNVRKIVFRKSNLK